MNGANKSFDLPRCTGKLTTGVVRSAFTLIEILVVVALAAILAAIVTVSLTGTFRTARAEDAAGRIATYERTAREYFRKFGRPGRIVFDLERGTVTRIAGEAGENTPDNIGGALHLPPGIKLDRVMSAAGTATYGQLAIGCSREGQTHSYAVRLTDANGDSYWVVTAGLTGQTVKTRDEKEVQDIFRAIHPAAAGDDAH